MVSPMRLHGLPNFSAHSITRFRGGDDEVSLLPTTSKRSSTSSVPVGTPASNNTDDDDGMIVLTPTTGATSSAGGSAIQSPKQDLLVKLFQQIPLHNIVNDTQLLIRIPKTIKGDVDIDQLASQIGLPRNQLQFNGSLQLSNMVDVDISFYNDPTGVDEKIQLLTLKDEYDLEQRYPWVMTEMVVPVDEDHEFFDFEVLASTSSGGSNTTLASNSNHGSADDTLDPHDTVELALDPLLQAIHKGTVIPPDDEIGDDQRVNAMHVHPSLL